MYRTATSRSAMAAVLVAGALASGSLTACGLADVFAAAGVGDVRFAWAGDTLIRVDQAVAIRVTVSVGETVVDDPRIVITVPDTTINAITATGDSIVGRRSGRGTVVARLVTSLTVGQQADTAFSIRVTGGGPPTP